MKKSSRNDVDKNHNLFADEHLFAQKRAVQCQLAENTPNAYAEESQAPMMFRRRFSLDQYTSSLPDENLEGDKTGDARDPDTSTTESKVSAAGEPVKCEKKSGRKKAVPEQTLFPLPRLMTTKNVAEYFGFSVSKVVRLEKKEPSFPRSVRIGGSKRWDRQAIDHYIDQLSSGR